MTTRDSASLQPVYLIDGLRTPIGKFGGTLSTVRSDDLAALIIKSLAERHPKAAEKLDQVVLGDTNQAGEDNRNVARMALLLAGLPFEVPAVTVNRLCGSGLEAIASASRMIATGEASAVIAGGVESMSRAPLVMAKAERAFGRGAPPMFDSALGWRFVNPKMKDRFDPIGMGNTAENVAEKHGITREQADKYALESHRRAAQATESGRFQDEVVPVSVPRRKADPLIVQRDESVRPDSSPQALAKLRTVFKDQGTVTAGNASPLSDGAAGVLLASGDVVEQLGLEPMARLVTTSTVGLHPNFMGEGPIGAIRKLFERTGLSASDIDLFELNEAFAVQALACVNTLQLDMAKVNVNGGAIALGHPIGCSGARIMVTLAHEMRRRDAKRGVASLCIGVGQGIATLIERA